ncbi:hypothetical protein AGDE_13384 [Angomonas deanei]|nr:hypothetical protein AGDE_13384 [Angomonas deanei]|eukprot:EPY22427.1 hypothetical protein AGDE_13384 [Angomonas deanei]
MLRYRHNPHSWDESIIYEARPAAREAQQAVGEVHYLTSLCRHGDTCLRRRQGTCLYAHHPGELMNNRGLQEVGIINDVDAQRAIYSLHRRSDWHAWLAEEDKRPDRCVAYLAGEAVRCRDGKYRCCEGCTLRHARFPRTLGEYL